MSNPTRKPLTLWLGTHRISTVIFTLLSPMMHSSQIYKTAGKAPFRAYTNSAALVEPSHLIPPPSNSGPAKVLRISLSAWHSKHISKRIKRVLCPDALSHRFIPALHPDTVSQYAPAILYPSTLVPAQSFAPTESAT